MHDWDCTCTPPWAFRARKAADLEDLGAPGKSGHHHLDPDCCQDTLDKVASSDASPLRRRRRRRRRHHGGKETTIIVGRVQHKQAAVARVAKVGERDGEHPRISQELALVAGS